MKNTMQLKAIIKNIAKEKNIPAQLILQNYMLERLLERISLSNYRNNFVIKGGFLISAIVGISHRTTMDMDATIIDYRVDEENIKKMIDDISSIDLEDGILFEVYNISTIRENDNYNGFRVSLYGNYGEMKVPLKIDITTGDMITPKEVIFDFSLMIEDRSIKILAYNLSTIIAEKLETIISRGEENTRLRDYYDIYIINKLNYNNFNLKEIKEAILRTSNKRKSLTSIMRYKDIISYVRKSAVLHKEWDIYKKRYDCAKEIQFEDVCDTIIELMDKLFSL